MDRKYIKSILSSTNMINTINRKKTSCDRHISPFYFFRIFAESFETVDIKMTVKDEIAPAWSNKYTSEEDLKIRKIIYFQKGFDEYTVSFDQMKLEDKILYYNSRLDYIGFI